MATSLDEFLQSLRKSPVISKQTTRGKTQDWGRARDKGPRRRRDDTPVLTPSQPEPYKTLPASNVNVKDRNENYLETLPSEIILKILSFLDASSLFSISFVNKRFHDLANNNCLWSVLYASETEKKWRPWVSRMTEDASSAIVEEKPEGYWKKMLLKEMAGYKDIKWKTELRHKNPHTGMPALIEDVIRRLCIQWELILTYRNGRESVYKQTHTFFEESSVTVYWTHGYWPLLLTLTSLKLHGITCSFASGDKPRWRSLVCKTSLDKDVHWLFLGADKLVRMLQFDKVIIGVWRGNWKIAFVLVNLHFHKLIERSLLGSRFCPYMPTDNNAVDTDCGHHGYTLHLVLHNPLRRIMCQRFSPLYTSRGRLGPQGDYLHLNAIHLSDVSEHIPVPKISLPWQAAGLQGDVEHCCMMTLTVLDEAQRPFWCVSSPVKLSINLRVVEVWCEGEQFVMLYEDAEGRVKMTFVWMEETQHYFLVQLSVAFPAVKVKRHTERE